MGPEGLVPLLLVFGVFPSLPIFTKILLDQKIRMAAKALARSEMASVTAELRIVKAFKSKLRPAPHFQFRPSDVVCVYKVKERK